MSCCWGSSSPGRMVVSAIGAIVLVGSCGTDESPAADPVSSADPTTTDASAPSDEASATAVGTTVPSEDAGSTTTGTPVATEVASTVPAPEPGSGVGTEFCDLGRSITELSGEFDPFDDPEVVEAVLTEQLELVTQLPAVSPARFAPFMETVVDFAVAQHELYASHDFVGDAVLDDPAHDDLFEEFEVMSSDEFDAAGDELDEYCGLDGPSGTDPVTTGGTPVTDPVAATDLPDVCGLLDDAEVASLVGDAPRSTSETGSIPDFAAYVACTWDPTYVAEGVRAVTVTLIDGDVLEDFDPDPFGAVEVEGLGERAVLLPDYNTATGGAPGVSLVVDAGSTTIIVAALHTVQFSEDVSSELRDIAEILLDRLET